MPPSTSASLQIIKPLLLPLGFIALVLLVNFNPELHESLRYQRSDFLQHWWQGFGHALPHVNFQHLSLNILALLCIWGLFPDSFRSFGWLLALAFSAMASALGLYFFSPATEWCVGLSGALHGLMVYAALRSRANFIWLLAIVAKLIAEQTNAFANSGLVTLTADYIGHSIVVDAHLWGAVGGFIFYLIVHIVQYIAVFIEINRARD